MLSMAVFIIVAQKNKVYFMPGLKLGLQRLSEIDFSNPSKIYI
jgi:hypothetical protein